MNVPLGIAAFVMAYRLLPKFQDTSSAVKDFDLLGTALLGATTFSLMLPFVLTTGTASDNPARWWWLVVALGVGTLFVLWEKAYSAGGKVAIIDFELFAISSFRNGILISGFYFAALPATFITLTLFLQQGLGFADHAHFVQQLLFAVGVLVGGKVGLGLFEKAIHGAHDTGRQQGAKVLARQQEQQRFLAIQARHHEALALRFPTVAIGAAGVVAFDVKALGQRLQQALDAAFVTLKPGTLDLRQQLARADLGVARDAPHQLQHKGQGFEGVGFFAGHGLLWCESVILDTKVP
jgi:hypothetical protein